MNPQAQKTYTEASLHKEPMSAEDGLKLFVAFPFSQEHYDQSMYVESARRVVYNNCMNKCELTDEDVPNWNKKFYYNQEGAQNCLQACFNNRMQLHFGEKAANSIDGLKLDFKYQMKQYQRYEVWHPDNVISERMDHGYAEDRVQSLANKLLEKTRAETSSNFSFQ